MLNFWAQLEHMSWWYKTAESIGSNTLISAATEAATGPAASAVFYWPYSNFYFWRPKKLRGVSYEKNISVGTSTKRQPTSCKAMTMRCQTRWERTDERTDGELAVLTFARLWTASLDQLCRSGFIFFINNHLIKWYGISFVPEVQIVHHMIIKQFCITVRVTSHQLCVHSEKRAINTHV